METRTTAMHVLERLIRDTAAVGISAAMLGLEIGTKLLRPSFITGPLQGPVAPHGPATPPLSPGGTVHPPFDLHLNEPTQEQIELRAYELWEQAGKPEGWDKEFYRTAERELRNQGWSIH